VNNLRSSFRVKSFEISRVPYPKLAGTLLD
jgi:hypothetical protein